MKTSFKLFNFVGAPVELSLWFLLIFLMAPMSWGIAIFFSVLIHEMAHAWVADRRGWRVYGIRVDLFTGSAAVDTNMPERDAIPVVAAGPLSNLLLSIIILLFTGSLGVDSINPIVFKFLNDLFVVNIILFIFNILPIYPMDGGRLVKDFLFLKMRSNRALAKKIAGSISLVFSIALLVYSSATFNVIMIIFSILFIYYALVELGIIESQK
jgi:Zn-dependent protease